MWNKKAVCFRYASVCKQMGLKYVKASEFERERKTNGRSTKSRQRRRIRRKTMMIDGVGDMGTIMSKMTVNGLR